LCTGGRQSCINSTEVQEDRMANREQRNNREKKKPKAEKNKKKGAAQPLSPFASTRMPQPPAYSPAEKKSP
jgi:hypothetical protein